MTPDIVSPLQLAANHIRGWMLKLFGLIKLHNSARIRQAPGLSDLREGTEPCCRTAVESKCFNMCQGLGINNNKHDVQICAVLSHTSQTCLGGGFALRVSKGGPSKFFVFFASDHTSRTKML